MATGAEAAEDKFRGVVGWALAALWLLWLLRLLERLLWLLGKIRGDGVAHEDGQGDALTAAGLELGIELVGQADHDAVGCRHTLPAC